MTEAGIGVDVGANIEIGIGKLTTAIMRLQRTLADEITYRQPKAHTARGWSPQNNTQLNANGFGIFDLGGPEMGERWNVKRIGVVRGDDATAAMTGRADWYVGPVISSILLLPYPSEGHKWPFAVLPNSMFITDNGITVIPTNNLFCVISGGTAIQSVYVSAEIEVIPDTARTSATTVM